MSNGYYYKIVFSFHDLLSRAFSEVNVITLLHIQVMLFNVYK